MGRTAGKKRMDTSADYRCIANGQSYPSANLVNPGNPAMRFVNPTTGQLSLILSQKKSFMLVAWISILMIWKI